VLTLEVLLLGLVAGFTIFLGLPIARLKTANVRVRGILNSITIGILFFLFVEVTEHAWQEVERSVGNALLGAGGWGDAAAFFVIFAGGLAFGLLSLVLFENRFVRSALGHGGKPPLLAKYNAAQRLALLIAVGIGLHNLSEGLAIGASGATNFAIVLAIGFALHNTTEGFGIAAPLTGQMPSWRFLGVLGLIGGGPTLLGTIIGSFATSTMFSVLFLSLAGGALLYVIKQLFVAGRATTADPAHNVFVMGGVVVGLVLGFATELIVELAAG
jgi:zinc transporter, ZIP family